MDMKPMKNQQFLGQQLKFRQEWMDSSYQLESRHETFYAANA
jgi:hypothetical protein